MWFYIVKLYFYRLNSSSHTLLHCDKVPEVSQLITISLPFWIVPDKCLIPEHYIEIPDTDVNFL